MDAKNVALLISGAGMLGSIVAGCLQLRYGFHVFKIGQGSTPAQTKMRIGKWTLDTGSTGVAVMGLAAFWAFAAVMMRPTLKSMSSGSYIVASANGVIGPTQLKYAPDWDSSKGWNWGTGAWSGALADAFVHGSYGEGKANAFDLKDLRVSSSPTCTILSVPLRGDHQSGVAYYVPVRASDGSLTFVPITIRHGDLEVAGAIESKPQVTKPQ